MLHAGAASPERVPRGPAWAWRDQQAQARVGCQASPPRAVSSSGGVRHDFPCEASGPQKTSSHPFTRTKQIAGSRFMVMKS